MLTTIYNADFNEEKTGRLAHSLVNLEKISFEDREFLKMKDEHSTKVGNCYQVPLPLKNETIIFPDNQHLEEKRLHYLKEKFLRNPVICRLQEIYRSFTCQRLCKEVNKGSN